MIDNSTIEKIKSLAKIQDFCECSKGYGQGNSYTVCPVCGKINHKKKSGLVVFEKKQTAKCFSCGAYYSGAIDFLMKTKGLDFPETLRFLGSFYGILIDEQIEVKPEKKAKKKADPKAKTESAPKPAPDSVQDPKAKKTKGHKPDETFCDRQLFESGLTYDDIRVETVSDDGTIRFISPFSQGTRDQYGQIIEHRGDDMLIRYFDLDGREVMYKVEKGTTFRPLVRVRWQNPAAHPDKDGEPIKYQSPRGSGSHVYIPEKIRKMYKHSRPIHRLYIQEGEKKAEKCCKHEIYSVGIMGINNMGSNQQLPDEIQLIIQRCDVKEVCFLLDSDWDHLSANLVNGQAVDTRPKQFFSAVRNYKDYLRTLANLGIPVEIYFGHIKENPENLKGIDDLLTGSLTGRETELKQDIDFAVNEKSGFGKWVNVYKITMLPDSKIADFWLLNDSEEFARYHRARLKNLKEFKLNGYLRRFGESGSLEMAQQLLPDERFWDEKIIESRRDDGNARKELAFNYVNAMVFLQNRGFFRYRMRSGEKVLIHCEQRVLNVIDHTDVKDFVKDFCREIKRNDVLNMLMRGGPQYLGPEKLSNLDIAQLRTERATGEKQCLFFSDKIWEISADGIKEINYGQFPEYIWSEKIINKKVKALDPLFTVTRMDDEIRAKVSDKFKHIANGEFFIDYTEQGKQCHFLSFLRNVSNFSWRKDKGIDKTEKTIDDLFVNSRHLINKLTAIGYLLHDYKDDNELKAVVAVDGKLSEVGASNGRSGKSIIGNAIAELIPQVIIDGKNKKLDDDNFRYHEVTEKTKNLFFDDVRANFDFESLFQVITGGMTVNQKSGLRFTLRKDETPKILITTNHALNGDTTSFIDRQSYIVFTDFYNENHKPVDDFGINFFSEWTFDQYNLFFNLMAQCIVLYLRAKQNNWGANIRNGIVSPPMEDVEKRKLRQTMGENFLIWADAFFHWDEKTKTGNLNEKHLRKELYDEFLNENPIERKYTTPFRFREKIVSFCRYKGFNLNPLKRNAEGLDTNEYFRRYPSASSFIGETDKTGGKEYFTLANNDFSETL